MPGPACGRPRCRRARALLRAPSVFVGLTSHGRQSASARPACRSRTYASNLRLAACRQRANENLPWMTQVSLYETVPLLHRGDHATHTTQRPQAQQTVVGSSRGYTHAISSGPSEHARVLAATVSCAYVARRHSMAAFILLNECCGSPTCLFYLAARSLESAARRRVKARHLQRR